jgi:hypothetical protein
VSLYAISDVPKLTCSPFLQSSGRKKSALEPTAEDEEHVLSIMVSLLNALAKDSMERIRFLAKFVEKDYEKLDRLLELRERFSERLERADKQRAEAGRVSPAEACFATS